MKKINFTGDDRQRLDIYLSGLLDITRSQVRKMVKSGEIRINEKIVNPGKILVHGDIITLNENNPQEREKPAPNIKIIYEDDNIIVIDKAPGVVVYPDASHTSGTLLDAIRDKIDINDKERPGVVHRLDKDTSGLIVFAKNDKTLAYLQDEIRDRKFKKIYLALVWGKLTPEKGLVDIPIQRSEKDRKKMQAGASGRESLTNYEVLKYYEDMTFLKVEIITGRTHQIRVHFAGLGFPVVGDKTYGKKGDATLNHQFLHAHELGFDLFGKKYEFKSDLPEDLSKFQEAL